MARQIMHAGGNYHQKVNCALCKSDPRPRNCGNHCASGKQDPQCAGPNGGWPALPMGCCNPGAKQSCDGKSIATPDKDRGKDYNHSTFLDVGVLMHRVYCSCRDRF
jgi:hypothetical protein